MKTWNGIQYETFADIRDNIKISASDIDEVKKEIEERIMDRCTGNIVDFDKCILYTKSCKALRRIHTGMRKKSLFAYLPDADGIDKYSESELPGTTGFLLYPSMVSGEEFSSFMLFRKELTPDQLCLDEKKEAALVPVPASIKDEIAKHTLLVLETTKPAGGKEYAKPREHTDRQIYMAGKLNLIDGIGMEKIAEKMTVRFGTEITKKMVENYLAKYKRAIRENLGVDVTPFLPKQRTRG